MAGKIECEGGEFTPTKVLGPRGSNPTTSFAQPRPWFLGEVPRRVPKDGDILPCIARQKVR